MAMKVNQRKERVREYFDAIEQHEDGHIEELPAFVIDDVVNHNPVSSEDVEIRDTQGREAYKRHLESLTTAFPNLRLEIEDMVAEDDRVAVRFTLRGTQEGRLMGIEPTGRELTLSVIAIYRFEDGKIAERWGEASR
ncbi:ester cyclase [Natrinema salaciae]|uniref:SnoaL-like polyketide cyclase n=1 Tax=Natrinema salaciae TaxID=1186196 RepID=A0A1H9QBA7_9EURY|nr:ester cyclase [Natrinema salaciae]SER57791.1 conserved hypothetical protein, steroid delta-isomerase-related [Natrinema salaciae]